MSLKPKKVNFNEIWTDLKSTAEAVIKLDKVERNVWNTSFTLVSVLLFVL